jgi:uncharacterized membrane protein YfcA
MNIENTIWILLILMPVCSFLYASVGHGGASSYIMLLTLFNFAHEEIRPTALLLNIIVSGIAFIAYYKASQMPLKIFIPLILFSIPASFYGATITIDADLFRKILGIILIFPTLRLLNLIPVSSSLKIKINPFLAAILGCSIGFVSGLIGIGGGIILSPLLLMMGWTNVKETAKISALFIFVNSIAGIAGHGMFSFSSNLIIQIALPLTILGGIAGAWMGANSFNTISLRYLLAFVLIIAVSKFLFL